MLSPRPRRFGSGFRRCRTKRGEPCESCEFREGRVASVLFAEFFSRFVIGRGLRRRFGGRGWSCGRWRGNRGRGFCGGWGRNLWVGRVGLDQIQSDGCETTVREARLPVIVLT